MPKQSGNHPWVKQQRREIAMKTPVSLQAARRAEWRKEVCALGPCVDCGAGSGSSCQYPDGNPRTSVHMSRVERWEERTGGQLAWVARKRENLARAGLANQADAETTAMEREGLL